MIRKLIIRSIFSACIVYSNASYAAPEYSLEIKKIGATILDIPPGITALHIDACAAGAGGGGGNNAVAPGAGGSGGGAGQWVDDFILEVSSPQRITFTIPDGGAGGDATKDGAVGGDLTITGATNLFPPLIGGSPGKGTTTNYVTFGGDGGGKGGLGGLGVGPGMGGLRNTKPSLGYPHAGGGPGGGNGGGLDPGGAHPAVAASDGQSIGSYISEGAGSGLQAGGGGASSPRGRGGRGGDTSPVTAGASPTDGYCGGGGGGGPDSTTGKGGKGAQGWARVRLQP